MAIDDDPFKILDDLYRESSLDLMGWSSSAISVAAAANPTPALAIAAAFWTAFDRLSPSKVAERARTFQLLVRDELRRISQQIKGLRVKTEDFQASIQLATRYDAAEFDDKKRDRYIRLLTNSVISETKVDELANFIRSIESLGEDDVIGLNVLNRVMNRPTDWGGLNAGMQLGTAVLHPNVFLQRAQELAAEMARDFGKWSPGANNLFSREKGLQICLRLQGLGLAQEIQMEPRQVPIANYCARLTPKGFMLLRLLGEEVSNWEHYFDADGPL